MVNHPVRNRRYDSRVVALALLLAGCKSSSTGAPAVDGDGAADGSDVDEGDAALEPDSAAGDGSDAPSVADREATDGGADGDDPDGSAAADRDLCTGTCTVIAGVVACPTPLATCTRRCDGQFAIGVCLHTLRILLRCQMGAGPEAYDCTARDGATLKAGVCTAEKKEDDDCRLADAGM